MVDDRWAPVIALADASRRALYDYVRRQDHPVSREEAADTVGMARNLAAFHLDKLVDAGLLRAHYEAPAGQRRGRGRTPKVYQPTTEGLSITIPERRYELIAEILADAVVSDPTDAGTAARDHAHRRGHALGARLAEEELLDVLSALGFEPAGGDNVQLRNCPFHLLAVRHTTFVCGLNHAFLTGLVEGLGRPGPRARLAPRPGRCCVEFIADGTDPDPTDKP